MRFYASLFLSCILLILFSAAQADSERYAKQLCQMEGYSCLRVKSGQSWASLFSDPHDRSIVMRVNRMNTRLWGGLTIAVPDNLSTADLMDYAPFPRQIQPRGEKLVAVDPTNYAWGAYSADGRLIRWGPASSGADWCNDTDEPCRTYSGKFRVYSTGSSDCYSTKFPLPDGGAPMPYCMYFNNGQALHGEPNGLPGYNASHGCVRMYVSDAEWMRYNFIEGPNASNKFRGTLVLVGKYATPDDEDIADEEMNS